MLIFVFFAALQLHFQATIYKAFQLTEYRKPEKIVHTKNLLAAKNETKEEEERNYVYDPRPLIHWKPTLSLHLVHDFSSFSFLPPQIEEDMVLDDETQNYYPILYHNEFWQMSSHLIPVTVTDSIMKNTN